MSSTEINKVAASILFALIVAWVSALLANKLVAPKPLQHAAVAIATEGTKPAGGSQAAAGAPEAGPEPLGPLLASASVDAGKDVGKKCAACHTFDKGGANRVGPNLWGVVGDQIAHERGGYSFSDALNEWLWKPQAFAKGSKMTFVGLPKAKDRADMIAYLNSLSDSPKPLASP